MGANIGWLAIVAGLIIVFVLILWNRILEVSARNQYGPYKEDEEVTA
jgi:tetrahydromethanopterin S-methyltransferase subunit E